MWWNGRTLIQPAPDGLQTVRLDIDQRALAQLSGPQYHANSSGRIVIEAKKDMKKRGVSSPDRAEAILLALFEPPGKRKGKIEMPLSLDQSNPWSM
jgi:hypothetical protein